MTEDKRGRQRLTTQHLVITMNVFFELTSCLNENCIFHYLWVSLSFVWLLAQDSELITTKDNGDLSLFTENEY